MTRPIFLCYAAASAICVFHFRSVVSFFERCTYHGSIILKVLDYYFEKLHCFAFDLFKQNTYTYRL